MPELPEVETVLRGLEPFLAAATFERVELRRRDLRVPLPRRFAARLIGARVDALGRRGKYLTAALSSGDTLIMHLGMSGRFSVLESRSRSTGARDRQAAVDARHDHVTFFVKGPKGAASIIYNDPRRFGLMDLVRTDALAACPHLAGMGPEPLDGDFTPDALRSALSRRSASIKAALLDQRVVAGLGNIYACEALFAARLSPRRKASAIQGERAVRLHAAIRRILLDAIEAGGSTLRDFAAADGALGYFQQRFKVYGREGSPCPRCRGPVRRVAQSGRSTFYCPTCQR